MSSRLLSKSFVSIARSQRSMVARIHTQTPSAAMPALKEELSQSNALHKFKVTESATSPYFNTGKLRGGFIKRYRDFLT